MKNYYSFIILLISSFQLVRSQDTFSIVAMDPITGEVGSAGASCVDLIAANFPTDDFLGELFPGVGAINTQAWYNTTNQANARNRMNLGDTPSEIIEWLIANDVTNQPELRQYGIVGLVEGTIEAAGYTGVNTDDYKNHIIGANYSIQGNILLGEEVLLEMEEAFLAEEGNLACKLLAALQGAKRVGADIRCTNNGTSSLFAFVKVAQPTDIFGSPSFLLSIRTASNDGVEPIDELQLLFDDGSVCEELDINENEVSHFSIYPNPSNDIVYIKPIIYTDKQTVRIITMQGRVVYEKQFIGDLEINISELEEGVYFFVVNNGTKSSSYKWIKN